MAQAGEKTTGPGNEVPHQGDHDRVAMLSVRADGVPDQHNPEVILTKEEALTATTEQFRQQAVSAVDVAERRTVSGGAVSGETVEQDPKIAEVQQKTEAAATGAEGAAEAAVSQLVTEEPPASPAPGNTEAKVPAGERKPADSK